jgi:RHS repeat-associated protein
MNRYLIAGLTLFACCIACTNLNAEAASAAGTIPNTANGLVNFESEPSSVVAGKVCVITGDYVESHVDFASAGIDSFVLHRTYSDSRRRAGAIGGYWALNHHGRIVEHFDNGKLETFFQDEKGGSMQYSTKYYKPTEMNKLAVHEESLKKGVTNCADGEISGKTNYKNTLVTYDAKETFSAITGSGAAYQFIKRPYGHLLEKVHKPNKNQLLYTYSKGSLKNIKVLNRSAEQLFSMDVEIGLTDSCVTACDGRTIRYIETLGKGKKRERLLTFEVLPSFMPWQRYFYSEEPRLDGQNRKMFRKEMPEGQFLAVEYYHGGSHSVAGHQIHIGSHEDPKYGRIKRLRAPVGCDQTPITTHTFVYDIREMKARSIQTILGGVTYVHDAMNHLTSYHYSDDHRLTCIEKYTGATSPYEPYAKEKFYWGNSSNLAESTNLISRTLESKDGWIRFCRHFKYDPKGNVVQDTIYGNLSGKNKSAVVVENNGTPQQNGCECYCINYRYSNDGLNLRTYEEDSKRAVAYSYVPGSDLMSKKLVLADGKIHLRTFYEYDINGALSKEILDDGSKEDANDLTDVTERRIKEIKNRSRIPIGLPEVIEEKFLDLNSGRISLMHKTVNDYNSQGHLIRQEHYDDLGAHAYTLHWEYDQNGNLIKETDPTGHVVKRNYDANGNLVSEIGPSSSHHMEYRYDFSNRLIRTEKICSDGSRFVNTFRYDYLGNKIASTDYYGNETQYIYDELGRVTQVRHPRVQGNNGATIQPTIKKCYNIRGDVSSLEHPDGKTLHYRHNIRGQITSTVHPDGCMERFIYDLNGNLLKATNKNGSYVMYKYDYLSRPIKTTTYSAEGKWLSATSSVYNAFHLLEEVDAKGVATRYSYYGSGLLKQVEKGNQKELYFYDPLGRLNRTHEFFGAGEMDYIIKINEYDHHNRILEEQIQDSQGLPCSLRKYAYDELGRQIQVITYGSSGSAFATTRYNAHHEPVETIDQEGQKTVYTYNYAYHNEWGQCVPYVEKTDPSGTITIVIKDTLNRDVKIIRKNLFGEIVQQHENEYDAAGNLTKQTETVKSSGAPDRQILTVFAYDSTGRLQELIEGYNTLEQKRTRYEYNSLGLKDKIIKPDETAIFYTYDSQGRLTLQKSSDGSCDYAYEYNRNGQVISIEDRIRNQITLKKYDANDRMISETLGNELTMVYKYDRMGRVTSMTLPDESKIKYIYEAAVLREVQRRDSSQAICYSHMYRDYDLSGHSLARTLIGQCGALDQSYDLLGRCIEIKTQEWEETSIKYDPSGNVIKRQIRDPIGTTECSYAYDSLNQLISEKGPHAHLYAYDSIYNRIAKDEEPCTFNALNQLLEDSTCRYQYDLNGRRIQQKNDRETVQYSYDALDRLVAISNDSQQMLYQYDAENRRLSQQLLHWNDEQKQWNMISESKFLYQGLNEVGRFDASNHLMELRVLGHGLGGEIGAAIAIESGGGIYAPIHDHQGNVTCLIDCSSNEVKETYHYSVFGEEKIYDGLGREIRDSINPWRFSSKRTDSETGLVFFGHRYYDPKAGRWISPDPIGLQGGSNLYAYVGNNPATCFDRYGLFTETPWEGKEPARNSIVDRVLGKIGDFLKVVGDHLLPIPFVRDVVSYIGHRLGGGKHETFRAPSKTAHSHNHYLHKPDLNVNACIINIGGILQNTDDCIESSEQLSKYCGNSKIYYTSNSTHGAVMDLLESLAQKFGFPTRVVRELVKNIQGRIRAMSRTGSDTMALGLNGYSQGGLVIHNALKYLTPAEKKIIHVLTLGTAKIISSKGLGSARNFVNSTDIIRIVNDPIGWLTGTSTKKDVEILQTNSNPLDAHSFFHENYQNVLKQYYNKFVQTWGN